MSAKEGNASTMLWRLCRQVLRSARQEPAEDPLSSHAVVLIDFLMQKISTPKRAVSILTKVPWFKSLPPAQQSKELAALYLRFEQYLVEADLYAEFTATSLRELVGSRFTSLLAIPEFGLIFQPPERQEVLLCKALLRMILQRAFTLLGATGGNYLTMAQDWLVQVPNTVGRETPFGPLTTLPQQDSEWVEALGQFSSQLYQRLEKLLGSMMTRRLFEECYGDLAADYMLLETFPVVLSLLPDFLLTERNINLLDRHQIRRVLLDKLKHLEQINRQLSVKNQELEVAKRSLIEVNEVLRTEIAERQRTEQALRTSEVRMRATLESALDCIITIDREGKILQFNPSAERVFGYGRDAVLGKLMVDLIIPPRFRDQHRAGFAHYLTTGEKAVIGKRIEIFAMRADGTEFPVELAVTNIEVNHTQTFTAFIRDITERQQTEEALRRSERRLLELLEEREKISQDLHDGLIQSVYAIGLNLKVCQRLVLKDPVDAERKLSDAVTDLNGVIRMVRSFVTFTGLDQSGWQGLGNALTVLVRMMEGSHAMRFLLELDPPALAHLSAEQSEQLLYIAQEGMSNSLRHSRARIAVVSLHEKNGSMRLQIADDGVGFEPNRIGQDGRGLNNISARAKKLGARFTIFSQPRCGTRLILDIPLESPRGAT